MKKFIDFYMVTISPWSYLSLNRLRYFSEKYDLNINIKPIDIFSIFKENNTKGVKERPIPIQKNRINELKRWSKYLNIKLNERPRFHPVNPELSSKIIISSLLYENDIKKSFNLTYKLCEAVWIDEIDVSDKNAIKIIANDLGLKQNVIKEYYDDVRVNKIYIDNTQEARRSNVFGVPSFIFEEELYFGQDRMFMLEESIKTYL